MLVYHGTSADNLESIKKHGLLMHTDKIWNASLHQVYVWSEHYLDMEYPDWRDDEIDSRQYLIKQAAESAMCAAAVAKDCRLVVVICDVPEDELSIDNSCPNMQDASCIDRDISPDEIVEILVSNDFGMLKGYFISTIMDNELYAGEFSRLEMQIAHAMRRAEIDNDAIDDIISWETHLCAQIQK